jgi:hypothetical protein
MKKNFFETYEKRIRKKKLLTEFGPKKKSYLVDRNSRSFSLNSSMNNFDFRLSKIVEWF